MASASDPAIDTRPVLSGLATERVTATDSVAPSAMEAVSRTAYYCCGVRALDAGKPDSQCHDLYASRFMDDEAWRVFAPFRPLTTANVSAITRHRIIDDLLRERLAVNPQLRVVLIGAGFDARAFRLAGGRWLEVDAPALFAVKEARLPQASCPNSLIRVSVDFANQTLSDCLGEYARPEPAVVVVEGVLFYLGQEKTHMLVQTIRALFPHAELIIDVMTHAFLSRWGRPVQQQILGLGAQMLPPPDLAAITQVTGFEETKCISIPRRAVEQRQLPKYVLFGGFYGVFSSNFAESFQKGFTVRAYRPLP